MQITTSAQRGQTQFLKAPSSWVCLSFVAAVGLLSSGCASVTGSPNQNVSVQAREQSGTEVKGANCELTNNKGKWFVTTPGSVGIHRSNDDLQVLCTKDGIEPGRAAVVSETKGSMFGNIILGGAIGAIIDHTNGSAYEYPAFIQVIMGVFSKLETSKPSPSADTQPTGNTQIPVGSIASASASANPKGTEDQLRDLKRLKESGLIDQDVYLERQRRVLEGKL